MRILAAGIEVAPPSPASAAPIRVRVSGLNRLETRRAIPAARAARVAMTNTNSGVVIDRVFIGISSFERSKKRALPRMRSLTGETC